MRTNQQKKSTAPGAKIPKGKKALIVPDHCRCTAKTVVFIEKIIFIADLDKARQDLYQLMSAQMVRNAFSFMGCSPEEEKEANFKYDWDNLMLIYKLLQGLTNEKNF